MLLLLLLLLLLLHMPLLLLLLHMLLAAAAADAAASQAVQSQPHLSLYAVGHSNAFPKVGAAGVTMLLSSLSLFCASYLRHSAAACSPGLTMVTCALSYTHSSAAAAAAAAGCRKVCHRWAHHRPLPSNSSGTVAIRLAPCCPVLTPFTAINISPLGQKM
jgi:hypothetical protein